MQSGTSGLKQIVKSRTVLVLAHVFFITLYIHCAQRHTFSDDSEQRTADEGVYLAYSRNLLARNGIHTDGGSGPLYPLIISAVQPYEAPLEPGQVYSLSPNETEWSGEDLKFLTRARFLSIYLSVVLLYMIYTVFRLTLPHAMANLLTLVIAFGCFVLKAGQVNADLTFATLMFLSWFGMCSLLHSRKYRHFALVGLCTGLAFLTRPAIMPLIILLAVFFTVRKVVELVSDGEEDLLLNLEDDQVFLPAIRKYLIPLLVFLSVIAALISPYLRASKAVHGRYFINTTALIAPCDLPPETTDPKVTADEKGLTLRDIPSRWKELALGIPVWLRSFFGSGYYRTGKYIILLAVFLIVAARLNKRWSRETAREHRLLLAFSACFFLAYFLADSLCCGMTANGGPAISLILPVIFALGYALSRTPAISCLPEGEAAKMGLPAVLYLLTGSLLLFDILEVLFQGIRGA